MILCDRRDFVTLSLASFVRLSLALPSVAQAAQQANRLNGLTGYRETVNWDAFLEYVEHVARGQYRQPWDQSRYVREIETLAHSLNLADSRLQHALDPSRALGNVLPRFNDLE